MEGGGKRGDAKERLLPAKEELGNLAREGGTLPLRLLFLKFNCCKFGRLRPGSSPEKELLARIKEVSRVRLEMEEGMVSLKALKERSSTVRFFQTDRSDGRGPENLLNCR